MIINDLNGILANYCKEIKEKNPPCRSSYFGIIDLAGFPKDRYYLYQSQWRSDLPIHAHAEGVQPNGKITERLTYCDTDSRGSRGDGGKTGWNETNGALMALEIPGIYVRKDLGSAYVFDHVEVKDIKAEKSGMTLTLHNPAAYDATVTILAEDATQAAKPLGENAFLDWTQKVVVKAGKTVVAKVK